MTTPAAAFYHDDDDVTSWESFYTEPLSLFVCNGRQARVLSECSVSWKAVTVFVMPKKETIVVVRFWLALVVIFSFELSKISYFKICE
jgi:hypothetical protein